MIGINPTDQFDTNLQVCYEILLYLSSRVARLQPGEVLEFTSGDPDSGERIAAWCDMRGYTLLESVPVDDGRTRFLIQK